MCGEIPITLPWLNALSSESSITIKFSKAFWWFTPFRSCRTRNRIWSEFFKRWTFFSIHSDHLCYLCATSRPLPFTHVTCVEHSSFVYRFCCHIGEIGTILYS
jgi:hypothetical protein